MDLRSFAEVLASRQGGVQLKPGKSYNYEVTGEELEKIFGSKPAAFSAYGLTIMVKEISLNKYNLVIRRER